MRHNEAGGGAQTNANGLKFEERVSLSALLPQRFPQFHIENHDIFLTTQRGQVQVAQIYKKIDFWSDYVKSLCPGILGKDSRGWDALSLEIWSKMMFPDQVLIVHIPSHIFRGLKHRIFIIEMKTQEQGGSVDEKIQTIDFKTKQYLSVFRLVFGNECFFDFHFVYFLDNIYCDKVSTVFFNGQQQCVRKYRDAFNYVQSMGGVVFFPEKTENEDPWITQRNREALCRYFYNAISRSAFWPTTQQNQPPFQFQ